MDWDSNLDIFDWSNAQAYISTGVFYSIRGTFLCMLIYVVLNVIVMIKQFGVINLVNQVGHQMGMPPILEPGLIQPGRVQVQATSLPCYLQLKEGAQTEAHLGRVPVSLSSREGAQLQMRAFYGVDIGVCHHVMAGPWLWLEDAFLNGRPFGQEGCLDVSERVSVSLKEGETRELVLPGPSLGPALDLGSTSPRDKYPIVLICLTGLDAPTAVVATFHIIHIQDDVCTIPTQILSTYVKRRSGPVIHLEGIFNSDSFQDDGNQSLCVVCLDRPISRVHLPCKHACVCQRCFGMIRNLCPMCRGPIKQYFLIRAETQRPPTYVQPHPTE